LDKQPIALGNESLCRIAGHRHVIAVHLPGQDKRDGDDARGKRTILHIAAGARGDPEFYADSAERQAGEIPAGEGPMLI
jgi:hypothetical protein